MNTQHTVVSVGFSMVPKKGFSSGVPVKRIEERTKLDNTTSRLCPRCRKRRRRLYSISQPKSFEECNERLAIHYARINPKLFRRRFFRQIFGIYPKLPWFECSTHAKCPKCDTEPVWIIELEYKRQFSLFRLMILVAIGHVSYQSLINFWRMKV